MNKKMIFAMLGLFLLVAIISQVPMDMVPVNLAEKMAPISKAHPLGTDPLGRDLLDLMVVGCLRTLLVILVAGAISLSVGVCVGILAGYFEGNFSLILGFFTDFLLIIPTFIVALLTTALFGLSPLSAGLALGLCQMGHFANHAATLTKEVKNKDYIRILTIMGYGKGRILLGHILPAILPLILPFFGSMASSNILNYASLAFIGLGSDITKPDWGTMLYQYRIYTVDHPLLVLWPSLGIFLLALISHILFDTRKVDKL